MASRTTGNAKAYGSVAAIMDKMTWIPRNFGFEFTYKGKKQTWHPLKMLAAFTRISSVIAMLQLKFTPVGYLNILAKKHGFFPGSPFSSEMSEKELQREKAMVLFGTVTMALLFSFIDPDDDDNWLTITGNGTGNYKDNEELRNTSKWRPYSIYLGGMDGVRIPYKYTPFALLFGTVGYVSDRKKYVAKHKDSKWYELLPGAFARYPVFLAETTPLANMMKLVGDLFGAFDRGDKEMDVESIAKTLSNTAKGYYAPSLARDIIDVVDFIDNKITGDGKPENNEFYNSMLDRTVVEIVIPEDDFPMRDAWGLPVQRMQPMDEFMGIGADDSNSELIRYHWKHAGALGKPDRTRSMFELWYNDGSMQDGLLSRKHEVTRRLWNEVYLKTRGELLREAVMELKADGYTGEEYRKEFAKRKDKANEEAKKAVETYTYDSPLKKEYKEDK
jgi:hypothetical protein